MITCGNLAIIAAQFSRKSNNMKTSNGALNSENKRRYISEWH